MCEFCVKHGEGKKWYLQAKNYSEELLDDTRRSAYIRRFISNAKGLEKSAKTIERLDKIPLFLKRMFGGIFTQKLKETHYGQVVPIEDIEKIFEFVNSVVRITCICRYASSGEEKRCCYAVSLSPNGGRMGRFLLRSNAGFLRGPDAAGLEVLGREAALEAFRSHEREGLCHTVWTLNTPFIGAICNCDIAGCLAMRLNVRHSIPMMFPGEYIAIVDPEKCIGCGKCLEVCQFKAITFARPRKTAVIDQKKCYGCGICRSFCPTNAISLIDRS